MKRQEDCFWCLTIENESLLALRLVNGFLDDSDDNIVAHQSTGLHHGVGGLAHRGALLHSGAQHVTSGQMAQAVVAFDARSLKENDTAGQAVGRDVERRQPSNAKKIDEQVTKTGLRHALKCVCTHLSALAASG